MIDELADRPWASEIAAVAQSYGELDAAGFAKHVQLQLSVTRLIEAGTLKPGGQLPPEQELCRAVRVSLGTVQKALTKLASEGWIVREHGRGTFVSGAKRPITELWHFRFIDPETGRLMPVYTRLLDRRLVTEAGPGTEFLGRDPVGYVEITRLILAGDRLTCWSRMHLGAARFGGLLELPEATFDNVNLKQIFQQHFAAPTLAVTQTVKVARFEPTLCETLGVAPETTGLDLEITTRTHGGRPLAYQRVFIPPSDFALDVSPAAPDARSR